jgi:hypothetical protein
MIPPSISSDCSSLGEREIFLRLKNDPGTKNWIVLHSLDVAIHRKQISGEIDFLIIVPARGVLCIEVKACTRLQRIDGLWYYGSDPVPDRRGPFKQVSTSMHSMRKRLAEQRPDLSKVVFLSVVIFPYIEFSVKSDEWQPWQAIDHHTFRARPLSHIINAILDQARIYIKENLNAAWFKPEMQEPTPEQCEAIAKTLRPDFEFYESPKSRTTRLDEELRNYTEEQYAALDTMDLNPRVIFIGPAGTGKTLLAIESARRSRLAGKRFYLCVSTAIWENGLKRKQRTFHKNSSVEHFTVICLT